jgi:hypothetical protein
MVKYKIRPKQISYMVGHALLFGNKAMPLFSMRSIYI